MSGGVIPPRIGLTDVNGQKVAGNTLPHVGPAYSAFCLPVVLARGPQITQMFLDIPKIDTTSSDNFNSTVIKLVDFNINRRYLKIINNGGSDVELWNNSRPAPTDVGRPIPHGEVLYANGFGIIETDTCRTGAIFATCAAGVSGLLIMEG